MSNDLIPVADIERMATAVAKSGLFGMKTPEQAMALMLIAQAEGMHPALAARDYHIIQNRPTLKADAILSRFQEKGGKVEWHKYTDAEVSATFTHPQGGTVSIAWDMARAKQADLGSKDNWKKYPRQMLRARVISEGVRTVYPGATVGMYTPEEVSDFDDSPPKTKEITPKPKKEVIETTATEVVKGDGRKVYKEIAGYWSSPAVSAEENKSVTYAKLNEYAHSLGLGVILDVSGLDSLSPDSCKAIRDAFAEDKLRLAAQE